MKKDTTIEGVMKKKEKVCLCPTKYCRHYQSDFDHFVDLRTEIKARLEYAGLSADKDLAFIIPEPVMTVVVNSMADMVEKYMSAQKEAVGREINTALEKEKQLVYFEETDLPKEERAIFIKIFGDCKTPEYMVERRTGFNRAIEKAIETVNAITHNKEK